MPDMIPVECDPVFRKIHLLLCAAVYPVVGMPMCRCASVPQFIPASGRLYACSPFPVPIVAGSEIVNHLFGYVIAEMTEIIQL
jgi:hypothetical protein